ncbi:MAG TPA: cupredoxin domain-containing protein [Steroidobacteraceae bacterium]|jgi:plastocyanin
MKHSFPRHRIATALVALPLAIFCTAALLRAGRIAAAAAQPLAPVVTISNYSFQPTTLTVAKGATVTWVNKDGDVHTIKSSGGSEAFGSAALDSGDRFTFTFLHAGTYHYICSVHPYMHGMIVVR